MSIAHVCKLPTSWPRDSQTVAQSTWHPTIRNNGSSTVSHITYNVQLQDSVSHLEGKLCPIYVHLNTVDCRESSICAGVHAYPFTFFSLPCKQSKRLILEFPHTKPSRCPLERVPHTVTKGKCLRFTSDHVIIQGILHPLQCFCSVRPVCDELQVNKMVLEPAADWLTGPGKGLTLPNTSTTVPSQFS